MLTGDIDPTNPAPALRTEPRSASAAAPWSERCSGAKSAARPTISSGDAQRTTAAWLPAAIPMISRRAASPAIPANRVAIDSASAPSSVRHTDHLVRPERHEHVAGADDLVHALDALGAERERRDCLRATCGDDLAHAEE